MLLSHYPILQLYFKTNLKLLIAAFFPMWDILFGTYRHPQKNEFPATGIKDDADYNQFQQAYFSPFYGWMKLLKNNIQRVTKSHLF